MAKGKYGRKAALRQERQRVAAAEAEAERQRDLHRRLNDALARSAEAEAALLGASELLAVADEMDSSRVAARRDAAALEAKAGEQRSALRRIGRAWERDWDKWCANHLDSGMTEEALDAVNSLIDLGLSPVRRSERKTVVARMKERRPGEG